MAIVLTAAFWTPKAFAQTTVYWDTNGVTSGSSGGTTAAGTWDQNTTSNWTTTANGTGTTATWQTRSGGSGVATFSAGTNATGTYAVTVSGTVTGVRGITFEEGTVTLSGGTLQLGASSAINTGTNTASISSVIDGSGFAVTKSGTGTLNLSGANTYTGGTTLSAGTLNINNAAAIGTGTLTVSAGTIDNTSGSAITLSNNNAVTLGANLTFTGTNDLNLGTGAFSLGNTSRIVTVNGGNLTVGGVVSESGGNRALTKAGAGALTLTGANTYSGGTIITGGTLSTNLLAAGGAASGIGDASNASGNLIINGGTLQYTGGAQSTNRLFQIGQSTAGGTATIDTSGSGALNFTNTGSIAYGTNNQTRTLVLTGTNTGTNTLASVLGNNGSGLVALTKNGAGTWVLSGTNTYTGVTTINNGILSVATIGNGGVAGNLGQAAVGAGNLVLGGGTLQYTGSTASTNRAFTLTDATTSSIDIQTGGTNLTISGASAATTGSLTKIGAGTLTLTGANTYTGVNTVTAGTLRATTSNQALGLGTDAATVTMAGGKLELANDTALNFGRNTTVTTTGSTITSDRITSGAGVTQTMGTLRIGAQTLNVTAGSNVNSGTAGVTFGTTTLSANNATFDVGSGANLTLGAVGGEFSMVKQGTGTLTLNTASTRTTTAGSTTLTDGTLTLGTGNALNTSAATTLALNGGSLRLAPTSDTNTTFNGTATTVGGTTTIFSDRGTATGAGLSHTLGTLSIGNQTLNILAGTNVTSGIAGVTFGATTLSTSGAIFAPFVGTSLTLGSVTGTNTSFTVNGAGDATISGIVGTGTGTLTKDGVGTLTLGGSSSNTFTGTTTVSGGTLILAKTGGATAIGGNLAIGDGTGTDTVQLNAANQIAATSAVSFNTAGTPTLNLNTFAQTLGSLATTNTGAVIVFGSPASTTNLTVGGDNTSTTYAGTFTSGNGNAGLVKEGTGSLTLASSSGSYSGAAAVNAGTLKLASNSALGTGSAGTTVASGATLQIDGGRLTTSNGTLTLSGTGASGAGGALVGSGGNNRWNGNLALGADATIATSGTGYLALGTTSPGYSRALNDPLGTPTDTHTLDLSNKTLTLSGTTSAGDSRAIYVNARLTGTGNVVVNMTNPADIVRFTANQNTYTGTTSIQNGTLSLATLYNTYPNDPAHPNFFGINGPIVIGDGTGSANSARLTIQSGSTFDEMINYGSTITFNKDGQLSLLATQSIGALTFNGGNVDLGTTGGLYLNGTVTVNGVAGETATIGGTGTSTLSLTVHNGDAAATNRIFNVVGGVGNTSDLTINATINNGALTKNGAGTMTITSDNSTGYSGTTTINNGILAITNGNALGGTANGTTVNGNGTTNGTLQLQGNITVGAEALTLNQTGFNNNGALQNLSGNNTYGGVVTVNDARVQSDAGLLTLNNSVTINTALDVRGAGDTTISGSIGGASGTIAKNGTGTLTLSGDNTYGGTTTITQGVLSLQHNNGLGSASAGTTVAGSGAALELSNVANGNLTTAAEPLTLNGTGIGSAGALRNVAGNNTFQGAITLGSTTTIKSDSGTMTLSGGIAGTNQALTVGGAGNITSTGAITTGTIVTGAVDGHGNSVITSTGSSGTLTKVDAGTFTFGGGVTSNLDGITLTAGGIAVTGTGTLVRTGPISSAVGTTLTINSSDTVQAYYGSGDTTFSGALAGGGTFEKDGAGTLTFNQSFAATSLTLVINGGTLALANGANIEVGTIHITGNTILDFGSSTATVLTSATLIIDQGVTVTVNNWVSLSDAWYATNSFYQHGAPDINAVLDANTAAPENQITFSGYPSSWSAWVTDQGGVYNNRELRPIPEPSTYGLLFFGSSLTLLGARRFLRRKKGGKCSEPV